MQGLYITFHTRCLDPQALMQLVGGVSQPLVPGGILSKQHGMEVQTTARHLNQHLKRLIGPDHTTFLMVLVSIPWKAPAGQQVASLLLQSRLAFAGYGKEIAVVCLFWCDWHILKAYGSSSNTSMRQIVATSIAAGCSSDSIMIIAEMTRVHIADVGKCLPDHSAPKEHLSAARIDLD